jgi:hypothetical protein
LWQSLICISFYRFKNVTKEIDENEVRYFAFRNISAQCCLYKHLHVDSCIFQCLKCSIYLSQNMHLINRLGLCCLKNDRDTFNTISVIYSGGQFYWWRNQSTWRNLPQVTDKLYCITLHRLHLAISRIQTHTFSCDRHLSIQLPYDHDHDGPHLITGD